MEYKALQNLMKEIAAKAMLDKRYHELCLQDSQAAIRQIAGLDADILRHIVFVEEDGALFDQEGCIIPPYVKKSWLLSSDAEG